VEVGRVVALQSDCVKGLEAREEAKDGVACGRAGGVLPARGKERKHCSVTEIPQCVVSRLAFENNIEVHLVCGWALVCYGVAEVKVGCVSVLRALEANRQRCVVTKPAD